METKYNIKVQNGTVYNSYREYIQSDDWCIKKYQYHNFRELSKLPK